MAVVIQKAVQPDPRWEYLYRVTRQFLSAWEKAFVAGVETLRDQATVAALETALETGDVAVVVQNLPWQSAEEQWTSGWRPQLEQVMQRAGAAEVARLRLGMRFDIQNPFALRWLESHLPQLTGLVSEETRAAIRGVVLEGFQEGYAPRRMARRIRQMVGLTERDALAVERYWANLAADGALKAAQVDAMADAYARKKLRERALRIARHETVAAANAGTQTSWELARDQGLIAPNAVRVWIAASASDRTCPICLDLDGQQRPLDEPFYSGVLGIEVDGPPVHTMCRCAMGLETPVPE